MKYFAFLFALNIVFCARTSSDVDYEKEHDLHQDCNYGDQFSWKKGFKTCFEGTSSSHPVYLMSKKDEKILESAFGVSGVLKIKNMLYEGFYTSPISLDWQKYTALRILCNGKQFRFPLLLDKKDNQFDLNSIGMCKLRYYTSLFDDYQPRNAFNYAEIDFNDIDYDKRIKKVEHLHLVFNDDDYESDSLKNSREKKYETFLRDLTSPNNKYSRIVLSNRGSKFLNDGTIEKLELAFKNEFFRPKSLSLNGFPVGYAVSLVKALSHKITSLEIDFKSIETSQDILKVLDAPKTTISSLKVHGHVNDRLRKGRVIDIDLLSEALTSKQTKITRLDLGVNFSHIKIKQLENILRSPNNQLESLIVHGLESNVVAYSTTEWNEFQNALNGENCKLKYFELKASVPYNVRKSGLKGLEMLITSQISYR